MGDDSVTKLKQGEKGLGEDVLLAGFFFSFEVLLPLIAFLSERTATVCHRAQGYVLGLFSRGSTGFFFAYCSALVLAGFAEDLL